MPNYNNAQLDGQAGCAIGDLEQLKCLAQRHGVATSYFSYTGHRVEVTSSTLVKVLAAMDVNVNNDEDVRRALIEVDQSVWREILPPCVVTRQDCEYDVAIHVPDGSSVCAYVELEDGRRIDLLQQDRYVPPACIDGKMIGRATFRIPENLPLGWHTLVAEGEGIGVVHTPVAITPRFLDPQPIANRRAWGVMAQLYSVTSRGSWGHGDAADLGALATLSANQGADFVLINPVHADRPTVPLNPSPYLPYSRQFRNPIYIRPQDIPEAVHLDSSQREEFQKMLKASRANDKPTIDRDLSWTWKIKALELVYRMPRSYVREASLNRFKKRGGQRLLDFALWSALVEKYGSPLPEQYSRIRSDAVEEARQNLRERIDFYIWLQWIVFGQFKDAHNAAVEAGASIGIMHDLAVGIDPTGADVWTNPELFARGIQVGSPADMYNQLGQNWSQPPWRPDALRANAYRPLRMMVSQLGQIGGALRIDHIMGLFRLWWIPTGVNPAEGTYVYYNRDEMVGVLLLEAYRAGLVVIGEDLGTVEPGTREYLAERGILGTGVFWFEYEGGTLRRAENYRELQLATVNTHDLPPTVGYLRDVHNEVRDRLGLLEESVENVLDHSKWQRENMADLLFSYGLMSEDLHRYYHSEESCRYRGRSGQTSAAITGDQLADFCCSDAKEINRMAETVEALYRFVCLTPTKMVALSLVDATLDIRPQNQPGTYLEYPNWCVPLGNAQGETVTFEDLRRHPMFMRLCKVMNEGVKGSS